MALSTRLFVGNLPDNFNEHALREAFSSYGEIINVDIKSKPGLENDNKKQFAFITLSASNFNVESCIKYFTNEEFNGYRLYVTRARESFLERLQREREQSQNTNDEKNQVQLSINKNNNINDQHNTHKRKFENDEEPTNEHIKKSKLKTLMAPNRHTASPNKPHTITNGQDYNNTFSNKQTNLLEGNKKDDNVFQNNDKKQNSDLKRQESMKKKRQEFNEKKNIIKTGLTSIDKKSNKKIIFSDSEVNNRVQDNSMTNGHGKPNNNYKSVLFDDGASDDEINFEVKKQYEGKKGQKVLDLQSRYKSDKRFTLDERFVEDSESDKDADGEQEKVELNQEDEKFKQLNILQDVLGVTIQSKPTDNTTKAKAKLGMLRFDPTQPEHAKYLVPQTTEENTTKSKKKKSKDSKTEENQKEPERIVEKVEVSKEQFYKISDTLKDHNAMAQTSTFSLRSLFKKEDDNQVEDATEEDINYIPIQAKKDGKTKNPLDPGEKNPFVYDSSESEGEEETNDNKTSAPENAVIKTVWREKFFLSLNDHRLREGLMFFTKANEETQKERRELKSVMKKRINNKERKNTMFQKKIGGRKKAMRGKFRKN